MEYLPSLIYDPAGAVNLTDYGILVPALDTRATKTIDFLKSQGLLNGKNFIQRITDKLSEEDLRRVHSPEFISKLLGSGADSEIIRTYELVDSDGSYNRYSPDTAVKPLSELVKILIRQADGTLQAGLTALDRGFCFFLGGGMHHAQYERGAGFCLLNDMVLAARKIREKGLIKKAWIIDVDAHKGDGTAALCKEDRNILTLSIHMAEGWPLDPETLEHFGSLNPSLIPSTVEIPIEEADQDKYLPELRKGLERLRVLSTENLPELAFVVDGSDPFELDSLPSSSLLKLSKEDMLKRDLMIYSFLKDLDIPSAWVIGGGYGEESWRIHAQFLEQVLSCGK